MATKPDYHTLDAIAVVGSLSIVAGICLALATRVIPESQLAILASLGSAVMTSIPAAYAGFRFGLKRGQEQAPGTVVDTLTATKSISPTPEPLP